MDLINKIGRVYRCQKKRIEAKIASKISPDSLENVLYKQVVGHYPNVQNPQDWVEKLIWLNRNWITKDKVRCADKILMHEYLREKGVSELSVKILGSWDRGEDIDFDALPERFVLKCNHGSGFNIIVKDKSKLNCQEAIDKLNHWLTIDFSKEHAEHHYGYITRKILAEEFLDQLNADDIIDYKIYCFNGTPHSFFVCRNRNIDHVIYSSYTLDWQKEDYLIKKDSLTLPKPEKIELMVQYADTLSKAFPFVRIDFYEISGKLYLGEFTFTPWANELYYYYHPHILKEWGKLLTLPPAQNDFINK